jgi:hypothetical protein
MALPQWRVILHERAARIKHEVRDRARSVNIVVFQSLGRADFVVPGAFIRCFFGRPVAV